MLKQRIITALVLAAVLGGVLLFAPPLLFIAFCTVVIALAAWEWAHLAGCDSVYCRAAYLLLTLALMALGAYSSGLWSGQYDREWLRSILGLAGIWWAIALLWVMSYPLSAKLWGARWMRAVLGLLVLVPSWLGMVYLRLHEGGTVLILYVVAVVAAADSCAYFSGKTWGRRKMAPEVSPGKSWEGFIGGLLGSGVVALLAFNWLPLFGQVSFSGTEQPMTQRLALLVVTLLTALASVVGDLVESMVKRHRGVKDSGTLLPGHGGVMDRIDSLTAAMPMFALCLLSLGW